MIIVLSVYLNVKTSHASTEIMNVGKFTEVSSSYTSHGSHFSSLE